MSGKRVLDAIAILRVTRNVAYKHFLTRLSQAQLYSQTSSVFKAFGRRFPVTAGRVSQFSQSSFQQAADDSIPHEDKAAGTQVHSRDQAGIKQDHHYERDQTVSSIDTHDSPDQQIRQAQAKRRPLPDGTIPSSSSPMGQDGGDPESDPQRSQVKHAQNPVSQSPDADLHPTESAQSSIPIPTHDPLSPQAARVAQRQSEDPIPSVAADPPGNENEFTIDQEKDVYYQPPDQAHPVLSALPRVRVPKTENDVQGGDSHLPKDINADVFYSGTKEGDAPEPTEEQLAQLFHSPRAARALGHKQKYVPGGKREFHTTITRTQKSSEAEKQELQQLAQEMTKDVQENDVSLHPQPA